MVSVGGFDAMYAAFRRIVSRCFERWVFDAVYAAFRRSVSLCFERGGERWGSSGGFLTRCTQRSGGVFRGVFYGKWNKKQVMVKKGRIQFAPT